MPSDSAGGGTGRRAAQPAQHGPRGDAPTPACRCRHRKLIGSRWIMRRRRRVGERRGRLVLTSHLTLRLYVAGDGPNAVAARANLRRLLSASDPSTYSLEIVDCLRE